MSRTGGWPERSLVPDTFPPVKVKTASGDTLLFCRMMADILSVDEFTASENVSERIPLSASRLKSSTIGGVVSKVKFDTGMKRLPSEYGLLFIS